MLINQREQYGRGSFDDEAEIEGVVQTFAEQLFGASIIYLPQTRIVTLGGKGSIPDAIVIDLEGEQWYLVEAERAVHGTWEHIAPQVSKQLAALAFADTRQAVLQSALALVSQDERYMQLFSELEVPQIEIHGFIYRILQKPVIIAIPIDGVPKDLTDWIKTLRNQTRVWVIEKYVSTSDPTRVLYSLPDENLPTIETGGSARLGGQSVTVRSSQPYQELIESGLLKPGDQLYLEYGPRGAPRKKYFGTAREAGIEVDGTVYSASYAAVACMNKAGSSRKTANGWVMWRNMEGSLIDELYQRIKATQDEQEEGPDAGGTSIGEGTNGS